MSQHHRFSGYSEDQVRAQAERAQQDMSTRGLRPVAVDMVKEVRRLRPDLWHLTVTFARVQEAPRAVAAPLSDRPYANTDCPGCRQPFDPLPKRRTTCKGCGIVVVIRSGPDGRRYILDDVGLARMQAEWDQQAQAAWEMGGRGPSGNRPGSARYVAFEVVGESFYQAAIERICGGRTEESAEFECEALLVPDPSNQYDSNAVMVMVNGNQVGHLSRTAAVAYIPVTQALGRRHLTVPAMIVGGWTRGRDAGSFGVVLGLPDPDALLSEVRSGAR